jgi:hypothetical protein
VNYDERNDGTLQQLIRGGTNQKRSVVGVIHGCKRAPKHDARHNMLKATAIKRCIIDATYSCTSQDDPSDDVAARIQHLQPSFKHGRP